MLEWLFNVIVWLWTVLKPDDWGSFFWGVATVFIVCFLGVIAVGLVNWRSPLPEEEEFAAN